MSTDKENIIESTDVWEMHWKCDYKQVCTNGVVSFGSTAENPSGRERRSIPRGYGSPIIAAFWCRLETSVINEGRVYYRSSSNYFTQLVWYFLQL